MKTQEKPTRPSRIEVCISPDLIERLKVYAKKERTSVSVVIRQLVDKHLKI